MQAVLTCREYAFRMAQPVRTDAGTVSALSPVSHIELYQGYHIVSWI